MRDSRYWDKQLEGGLPDCRLKLDRRKTSIVFRDQLMEKVFCGNCGAPGGLVTAEWTPHIFYVCDECFLRCGPLPLPEIEENTVRGA